MTQAWCDLIKNKMWRSESDIQTYDRWDRFFKRVDNEVYPHRWYILLGGTLLGLLLGLN